MRSGRRIIFAALWILALVSAVSVVGKPEPVAESFAVEKGGNLVVDVENIGADVYVKVWSKSEVTVRAEGIREDDLERLKIEKDGNTVGVDLNAGYGRRSHREARFYINVPSEFNLEIGTSGGEIRIEGSIDGDVRATTAGGAIEVGDVQGEVNLRTAGGGITVGDVGGNARLGTSGGRVKIGDVAGKLSVGTSGGDIVAGKVGKDLGAGTAGGNIRCEKVDGNASAQTSGGNINLGIVAGDVTAQTAGGDIEVRSATGVAVAQTSGGDIELTNIVGVVAAATAGGDIRIELDPTNTDDSSIETKGGEVTLYLPADAKATIEAQIRLRDWDRSGRGEYEINSDFEAKERDRNNREIWALYHINGGGKVITIETVNGNIEIRKR